MQKPNGIQVDSPSYQLPPHGNSQDENSYLLCPNPQMQDQAALSPPELPDLTQIDKINQNLDLFVDKMIHSLHHINECHNPEYLKLLEEQLQA